MHIGSGDVAASVAPIGFQQTFHSPIDLEGTLNTPRDDSQIVCRIPNRAVLPIDEGWRVTRCQKDVLTQQIAVNQRRSATGWFAACRPSDGASDVWMVATSLEGGDLMKREVLAARERGHSTVEGFQWHLVDCRRKLAHDLPRADARLPASPQVQLHAGHESANRCGWVRNRRANWSWYAEWHGVLGEQVENGRFRCQSPFEFGVGLERKAHDVGVAETCSIGRELHCGGELAARESAPQGGQAPDENLRGRRRKRTKRVTECVLGIAPRPRERLPTFAPYVIEIDLSLDFPHFVLAEAVRDTVGCVPHRPEHLSTVGHPAVRGTIEVVSRFTASLLARHCLYLAFIGSPLVRRNGCECDDCLVRSEVQCFVGLPATVDDRDGRRAAACSRFVRAASVVASSSAARR